MLEDKELPTDIRRSESTERNASVVRRKIDWLDSKQIDRICSDHGITAHMFFISILSMLLARYYDCEDVVVGIPASCRVHPDTEKIPDGNQALVHQKIVVGHGAEESDNAQNHIIFGNSLGLIKKYKMIPVLEQEKGHKKYIHSDE